MKLFFLFILLIFTLTSCDEDNNSTEGENSTCNHTYSEYVETTAPTCVKKGEETATCTKCGDKKTKQIEPLGHIEGKKLGYYDEYHYYICGRENCNAEVKLEYHVPFDGLSAKYDKNTNKLIYECFCGYTYTKIPVDKLTAKDLDGKNPTKTIRVGETYTLNINVSPVNSDEPLRIVSISENIIEYKINDDNRSITFKALAHGKVTVVICGMISSTYTGEALYFDLIILEKDLKVTNIENELEDSTINLTKGDTYIINPILTPSNATISNLKLSSLNESIVTIDEYGKITAVSSGKTQIRVESKTNADVFILYEVNVTEPIEDIKFKQDEFTFYPTGDIIDLFTLTTIKDTTKYYIEKTKYIDSIYKDLVVENKIELSSINDEDLYNKCGHISIGIYNKDSHVLLDECLINILPRENIEYNDMSILDAGLLSKETVSFKGKIIHIYNGSQVHIYDGKGGIIIGGDKNYIKGLQIGDTVGVTIYNNGSAKKPHTLIQFGSPNYIYYEKLNEEIELPINYIDINTTSDEEKYFTNNGTLGCGYYNIKLIYLNDNLFTTPSGEKIKILNLDNNNYIKNNEYKLKGYITGNLKQMILS